MEAQHADEPAPAEQAPQPEAQHADEPAPAEQAPQQEAQHADGPAPAEQAPAEPAPQQHPPPGLKAPGDEPGDQERKAQKGDKWLAEAPPPPPRSSEAAPPRPPLTQPPGRSVQPPPPPTDTVEQVLEGPIAQKRYPMEGQPPDRCSPRLPYECGPQNWAYRAHEVMHWQEDAKEWRLELDCEYCDNSLWTQWGTGSAPFAEAREKVGGRPPATSRPLGTSTCALSASEGHSFSAQMAKTPSSTERSARKSADDITSIWRRRSSKRCKRCG